MTIKVGDLICVFANNIVCVRVREGGMENWSYLKVPSKE